MHYRDAMLHYFPDLDVKVIDHHFSDIFQYAKVDGDMLPEITAKEVPKVGVVADPNPLEVSPIAAPSRDQALT